MSPRLAALIQKIEEGAAPDLPSRPTPTDVEEEIPRPPADLSEVKR
jgi:hypothetical protein